MNKSIPVKSGEIIRTSDADWLNAALRHYSNKTRFDLIDDAGLGISESDLQSAVELIKALNNRKQLSRNKLLQILTGLGLSGIGIGAIIVAIFDPEPTSKLSILLAGGILLILTGGLSVLKALGQTWVVRLGKGLFSVEPKDGGD